MLRSIRELVGYTLLASDGEIGACADFLFDDRAARTPNSSPCRKIPQTCSASRRP